MGKRRAIDRRRGARRASLVALAALAWVPAACGEDGGGRVLSVPGDAVTIQAAVDEARPGDLVLIEAGVYHERVVVTTSGITVRGIDRNEVVLDGEHRLQDGIAVTADGVAVENLTVRNYRQNGVLFNGGSTERELPDGGVYGTEEAALVGYRVAYVTASNNGLYGIYAFAARDGLIDHVYASGSPDSGIYVGQCKPCSVVVTDSVAELNAIGYYGTNASGDVYVVDSVFRNNRLGMTPNSQRMELLAPQVETVIAGNLVVDNDDPAAPAIANGFFGGGIAIGGGTANSVLRNRVVGHDAFGIGVLALNGFNPEGNVVEGNVVDGNGVDLYFERTAGETVAYGNCFAENVFSSSEPADVEALLPCSGSAGDFGPTVALSQTAPPDVDHRTVPLPPDQPSRPGDPAEIPDAPAGRPVFPDLDTIEVPASS